MGLNLGNTNIGEIYLGNTKIAEAYLGSSKIYGSTPPGPTDEVKIGTKTWKTTNLAIDDGQGGIYTQTVNYGQGNVVEYYYSWDAANRIANSISGWHLPSTGEWNNLANAVGGGSTAGTKLKSTYGWESGNGTNDYGFAVFPAGYRLVSVFYNLYSNARFWTSTERSSTKGYYWYFDTGTSMYNSNINKSYYFSVRLVKDAT